MKDIRDRLINCFAVVFPELTEEEIVRGNSLENSDSLSWITLVAVIQEELGIELDMDYIEGSLSFEVFLERISDSTARTEVDSTQNK
jgi:acyl carrier protein